MSNKVRKRSKKGWMDGWMNHNYLISRDYFFISVKSRELPPWNFLHFPSPSQNAHVSTYSFSCNLLFLPITHTGSTSVTF